MGANGKMQRMNEDGSTTPSVTFTSSSSRLIIGVLVVFGIIAIIALVVAAVALSQGPASGSTRSGSDDQDAAPVTCYGSPRPKQTNDRGRRLFNIAVGHDYGAYDYIDSNGYLAGFTLDLISEVCTAAMIDCRIIWEPYNNCVMSKAGEHPRGGVGLMDGWYDACATWVVTVPRIHIFKFSQSYLKESMGVFYVKTTDNGFKSDDFIGKTIGFIDGWAYDEKCLARNSGKVLASNNIIHYVNPGDLYNAIINGKVDAGFAGVIDLKGWANMKNPMIKMVGNQLKCTVRGNGMISRKDNDFPEAFNEGLSKLMSSGRFKKLCDEASVKHTQNDRGIIDCV